METRDPVDAITEQWRRERTDLDSSPMEVLGRISRIAAIVQRELDRAAARHGLVSGDFDVLAAIRRAAPLYRLTPGELSRSTMITTGGMTKRLDRLEGLGLIRRAPDPKDRRGRLIALTPDGRELVDRALETHLENEEGLLDGLSPAKRRRLAALLRDLLVSIERPG